MMKKTIVIIMSGVSLAGCFAQVQPLTLKACIEAALANRSAIQSLKTDMAVAALQSQAVFASYIPQLSLSYSYRYNAIIPTQIVPVGQFFAEPTDEVRAIQFGRDWQQNAGVQLYQPVIDFSIHSRLAESRINEKLAGADFETARQELQSEVVQTFASLYSAEMLLHSAIIDTLRSRNSLDLVQARYQEGRVLKSDLNKALLNHNSALQAFAAALSAAVREKIYLAFLTGHSAEDLTQLAYDFSIFGSKDLFDMPLASATDSLPSVSRLKWQIQLVRQQRMTERRRKSPVLAIEGFLGASQYANAFQPLDGDSWYGSSYVGLSLQLPLITGSGTGNRLRQLRLREEGLAYELDEELKRTGAQVRQLDENIRELNIRLSLSRQNVDLLEENAGLYRQRLDQGQLNAYELNNATYDLQQERARLAELQGGLMKAQIERIRLSGALDAWISRLP